MGKQEEYLNVIDYSEYPGPRYNSQGPDSGEKFYVEKLNPVFSKCIECGSVLVVNLDGTAGFASSFLDEAFGQLTYDFGRGVLENSLKIVSMDEPEWPSMIWEETIPQWQNRREKGQSPKATMRYKVKGVDDKGNPIERESNESV